MATGFRNIPSAIAQQAALSQLREIQNPDLALQREIQKAVALQQIQQSSPAAQLALRIQQAQLDSQLAAQPLELARQNMILDTMRRAVPTELENQIRQATEQASARNVGIFSAPQIAGQPATLPALPVDSATQRVIAALPDDAALIDQFVPPSAIPKRVGQFGVFDPVTNVANAAQALERTRLNKLQEFTDENAIKQANAIELEKLKAESRGYKSWINPETGDTIALPPNERPPQGYMETANFVKTKAGKGGGTDAGGIKTTAEIGRDFAAGLSALSQVDEAIKLSEQYQKTGKFPTALDNGLNQFLGKRPQDFPGVNLLPGADSAFAMVQRLARGAQTKESRDLQMRKAVLASTIMRTQAGLSQTIGEAMNIAPYLPSESDTYESLVSKLQNLKLEGARHLNDMRRVFPALRDVPAPQLGAFDPNMGMAPSQAPAEDQGASPEALKSLADKYKR